MIGKVDKITKFGLFVRFTVTDGAVSSDKVGLLRWSALPKGSHQIKKGDLIGITVSQCHEDGKIELAYFEKEFKSTYGAFLEASSKKIETLRAINKEKL